MNSVSSPPDRPGIDEADRAHTATEQLWSMAALLLRRRWFIIGITFIVAAMSIGFSLTLQKEYAATARVLLPERSSSGLSAILGNLPAAASALLGSGGGDYTRYLAILNSRTVRESIVDTFDLVTLFETEEEEDPRLAAVETLDDYMALEVDLEFDYLEITAFHPNPEIAAEMANFMVRKLNETNMALASQHASSYRSFAEQRYQETLSDLDTLKDSVRAFQEEYGIIDLEAQTTAFFEQIANVRSEMLGLEIQYQALLDQYGADNQQVQLLQRSLRAAEQRYRESLQGREALLPVPQDAIPEVGRRFMDLEQERLIQERLLEVVAPLYEQARFEEEREFESVQVIDYAIPPVEKARPKRSFIVIVATFTAGFLSVLYVLLSHWWQHNHQYIAQRLQLTKPPA